MTRKDRIRELLYLLPDMYPSAHCLLNYEDSPEKLLLATILSARTTDIAVNLVTPLIWKQFPTLEDLAKVDTETLEAIIHPLGFFRAKTRSIKGAVQWLLGHDKTVPDTIEELITIPGVGRKTANVVIGEIFGKPAIIVDTHFSRLSLRLDLTRNTAPEKIEQDLRKLIPPENCTAFSHYLGFHGRQVCFSRKPKCCECKFGGFCPKKGT